MWVPACDGWFDAASYVNAHDAAQFIQNFGLPLSFLLLLAITGARRMWVFGWLVSEKDKEIQRERARADWWQQRALDQASMLDRSIELAARIQGQKRGE